MTINCSTIVKSKAPTRYVTQSGVVCWAGDDWGEGGLGGTLGSGGVGGGDDTFSSGGDSVVKTPTALQVL